MPVNAQIVFGDDSRLYVTALEPEAEPESLLALQDAVNAILPRVDLPEALLEVFSWSGADTAFTSIAGGEARLKDLNVTIAALLVGPGRQRGDPQDRRRSTGPAAAGRPRDHRAYRLAARPRPGRARPGRLRGTGRPGIPLRDLDQHLADHPTALISGEAHCLLSSPASPRSCTLRDTAVVRPACIDCGRSNLDLPRLGPNGRLYINCSARSSKGTCDRCGRTDTRLAARRAEGLICYSCYRVDAGTRRGMRRLRPIPHAGHPRPDSSSLCVSCWAGPSTPA